MSTFVIGDVQGCYDQLLELLCLIDFSPQQDSLWFTGDLVNRGPKSLEVLRFVSSLPHAMTVLGNHDLTLLALAYTHKPILKHTLTPILLADDREMLLTWLRKQPLFYENLHFNTVLVHAGIPPQWSIGQTKEFAKEVEDYLCSGHFTDLLENMFGNDPSYWDANLTGWERMRFIINSLTRMRFCEPNGKLNLSAKGNLESASSTLIPWFNFPRHWQNKRILFGHWAALEGKTTQPQAIALDTGCYWGRSLTALRLEDNQLFSVNCKVNVDRDDGLHFYG